VCSRWWQAAQASLPTKVAAGFAVDDVVPVCANRCIAPRVTMKTAARAARSDRYVRIGPFAYRIMTGAS
jgi:hypothetical protein